MPGGSVDNCITFQQVQNHVVIGDESTIDFSKYYHFLAMPDLRAFANASFPFSRMADLSESIVVMPKAPNEGQVTTLLDTMASVGAQTGLPAINVTLTDDGSQIQNKDADIMVIGNIPDKLKDDKRIDLLVKAAQSWVNTPLRQTEFPSIMPDINDRQASVQTTVTSQGPMAAVVGFQSPYNEQRSVVALLADSPRGYALLNSAMNDSGKRAAMYGSVAVIRESGVNSLRVAMCTMWAICRGSSVCGMRWLTIRFCWLSWPPSAWCCWRGCCGVCCVSSAVVALTRMSNR